MDNDKEFFESQDTLAGQMAYDELLSAQTEENQNQENDNTVLEGQVNLFEFSQTHEDIVKQDILDKKLETLEKTLEKVQENIKFSESFAAGSKQRIENKANNNQTKKEKLVKLEKLQNEVKQEKALIQENKTKIETKQIYEQIKEKQVLKQFEEDDEEAEETNVIKADAKEVKQTQNKVLTKNKTHANSQIFTEQKMERQQTLHMSIDEIMHNSMIPYTEYVVLDRALPRVEDGLKPVQRRILYSMLELGLHPDKPYRKSARIVGDCMGKYHPHGDSSVYDAMVRMSQDFSLREPLVKGHGNFGSIDGDSAAAMRYTEAKLTPLAMTLLKDLEKDTVPWSFNFDDTLKEPDMLPAGFPNLLVNGASGIAVGVATNIPPHNLGEVISATVEYISNPKISLDEMMKILPAPDFPTGGLIIASDELKQAYETGRGKIILRAKAIIEKDGDKKQIVITELPYQVNKATLLKKIADLKVAEKDRLSGIGEIRDESDRNGLRAVIKLKKDANAHAILEYLYKTTQLQGTFGINIVAIAGGRPKQLGLMEVLDYYVEYRRNVILKRTQFDLKVAKERAHIVEGLLIAIANIDEVIKIIKRSESVAVAKTNLKNRFNLSDLQAQAILDMRLARLVNLEIVKLEEELKELKEKIELLEAIVASKKKQLDVVKSELIEVKKQFSNARRSKLITVEDIKQATEMSEEEEEDAFAKEVIVATTAAKTIKQIPIKNYALSQKDLSKTAGLSDVHTSLLKVMSNDEVLIFTNKGNIIKTVASALPEAKWREKGSKLDEVIKNVLPDEFAIKVLKNQEEYKEKNVFFFTKDGYVKTTNFNDLVSTRAFTSATKLKDGDQLLNVEIDNENPSIVLVTKTGNALNFNKTEVPTQSKTATGVMGINLDEGDEVIFGGLNAIKGAVTLVSEDGFAKKLPISELNLMGRYRKGQKVFFFSEKAKHLIYASYSEVASNVVIEKGEKLSLIGQRAISYDSRTSKGKQTFKGKFSNAYNYEI